MERWVIGRREWWGEGGMRAAKGGAVTRPVYFKERPSKADAVEKGQKRPCYLVCS